jgi:hypothetical protein
MQLSIWLLPVLTVADALRPRHSVFVAPQATDDLDTGLMDPKMLMPLDNGLRSVLSLVYSEGFKRGLRQSSDSSSPASSSPALAMSWPKPPKRNIDDETDSMSIQRMDVPPNAPLPVPRRPKNEEKRRLRRMGIMDPKHRTDNVIKMDNKQKNTREISYDLRQYQKQFLRHKKTPKKSEDGHKNKKNEEKPTGQPVVIVTKVVRVVKEVTPVEIVSVVHKPGNKNKDYKSSDIEKRPIKQVIEEAKAERRRRLLPETPRNASMNERMRRVRQRTEALMARIRRPRKDQDKFDKRSNGDLEDNDFEDSLLANKMMMLAKPKYSDDDNDFWVPVISEAKDRKKDEERKKWWEMESRGSSKNERWSALKTRVREVLQRGLEDPLCRFFLAFVLSCMACLLIYGIGTLVLSLNPPRDDEKEDQETEDANYSRLPLMTGSKRNPMRSDYAYAPLPTNYQ